MLPAKRYYFIDLSQNEIKRKEVMLKINRQKITATIISGTILFMGGMTACGKTQTSETLVNEAKQYQQKGDNMPPSSN